MALTAAELRAVYNVDESELDKSLTGIPGKVKGLATKLAGAALVIGGAIGAGVLKGMDNEQVNDKLAAQLGLTEAESKRIGGVAGKLYAEAYGDSLGDVNTAVAAVMTSIGGMATASSKDLKDVTANALDFATAFEVDVTRAAQIAGQMLTNGLAKDAREAFDLMTAASQKVPAAVREDVLDAADEYGQFFAALGYDGEQAFGLLVKASEQGMYGIDKAGDAIKEFTIRATDMSTASKDAYKAIGLDAQKMAAQILAGGDTAQAATQKIIDGILGIEDPVTRANTAIALFGTPIEDLGTSKIPDFLRSLQGASGELENVAGAADRMGQTLNDNAKTRLEAWKRSAIQAFVNVLGGQVLPLLERAGDWIEQNFGPALQSAREWFDQLVASFSTGGESVGGSMGRIQEAVRNVVEFCRGAFQSLQDITASVVTIVTGLWDAFGANMVRSLTSSLNNILQVLGGALNMIKGILDLFIGIFTGDWSRAWDGIKNIVGGAWAVITGIIGQAANMIWTALSTLMSAAGSIVSAGWNAITGATSSAWNAVTGAVSGAWRWINLAVSNGVNTAVDWVRGLPGKAVGALGNLGSLLYDAGKDLIQGFINGIKDMAGKVGSAVKGIATGAVGVVKGALGINSPSRVFAAIGAGVGEGFVKGIAGSRPAVAREMLRLADTQALNGLARIGVRAPVTGGASMTGSQQTAGAAAAGGIGAMVNIEGDYIAAPNDDANATAQKLAVLARTGRAG